MSKMGRMEGAGWGGGGGSWCVENFRNGGLVGVPEVVN